MAADEDVVRVGLGYAGSDGAYADFGNQLYADSSFPVGIFQVVDQLGEIFD